MALADYYVNSSRTPVRATSPAAAVAKDLRAAGYRARARGQSNVAVSQDVAEMLGGIAVVYSAALRRSPVEVTPGGRYKPPSTRTRRAAR